MNLLLLTDHSTHSNIESIYPMAQAIMYTSAFGTFTAVSRSYGENRLALFDLDLPLFGRNIDESFKNKSDECWSKNTLIINDDDYDVVFLRIDRPFNETLVEHLKQRFSHAKFVNNPSGILDTCTKISLKGLTNHSMEIVLCEDKFSLLDAINYFGKTVLKPNDSYGSRGVVLVQNGLVDLGNGTVLPLEAFMGTMDLKSNPYVAVKFLEGVIHGDNRLLVANGSIVSSINRVPSQGGWISSLSSGASAHVSEPTIEELEIVRDIDPYLQKHGIFIYGADTLVNASGKRVLSEINTLNVGVLPTENDPTMKNGVAHVAKELIGFLNF